MKACGAGFVGEKMKLMVPPTPPPEEVDWCMMSCGDNQCKEYANIEAIDEDGNVIGMVYHVSECQMEDIKI